MLRAVLKRFQSPSTSPQPRVPDGERVYAIGDIHGRLDLLSALLDMIDADHAAKHPARRTLVFLGDLVDRGPQSAQVIERLMAVKRAEPDTRFLLGNHEEIMLGAIEGNREATRLFDRIGGFETMMSYGLSRAEVMTSDYAELHEMLAAVVPPEHIAFLKAFEDLIVIGDYAFVHAGIHPARALDAQKPSDLRWIRNRFLNHDGAFEKIIVHGHSITEEVDFRDNRIGIDTGAFSSDRLSALCLEGPDRQVIQTGREHALAPLAG